MFEEKNSSNNYEITRNEKENSNNKLTAYFQNSCFLAQQEQLSLFIKNFPIIRMDQVKSVNKLIELLIKQNEMLGGKCQQNVFTIKEMYGKHQDLLKNNRQLQGQISQSMKHLQYNSVNQQQIDSYQQQLRKTQTDIKVKEDDLRNINEKLQQSVLQNQFYRTSIQQIGEVLKLTTERNFKKAVQKVKQISKSGYATKLSWIDLDELERYMKQQKKRTKYSLKIKETVELFTNRFFKISEHFPVQLIREQFTKEVNNLLDILDDLLLFKKKNNMLSSISRVTDINGEAGFFEGLLDKMMRENQKHTTTKSEITNELLEVRKEMTESKNYYEQYLIKIKMQFQQTMRRKDQEVSQKIQMIQYYEENKEQTTKQLMDLKNVMQKQQETINTIKNIQQTRADQLRIVQLKLQSLKGQSAMKEREMKEQWDQNIKTYQYKLLQKQQILEDEQKQRKNIKMETDEVLKSQKLRISELEQQLKQINNELRQYKMQKDSKIVQLSVSITKLQSQLQILLKEVSLKTSISQELTRKLDKEQAISKKLKEQMIQDDRERNLQTTFIKQLQTKNNDLLAKIKLLQSKKTEDKTAKKELTSMKQTMVQQKKYIRQIQQNYQGQKQQNQRLKNMIKQMKKQLQQVYLQFNHLKMIQNDRQKLIAQIQKSDRLKEEMCQEYEAMKIDQIKLQQQNKGLLLEVKHYRNALSRIQALK